MNSPHPPLCTGGAAPAADAADACPTGAGAVTTPRTSSRILLGEGGELVIDHRGREYRLRITQNGKLILTA